jgi:transcriptional regulator with XRE-family HTH domain
VADQEDDASELDRRIGRRLRELRLAQKLTQGELARGRYTAAYISSVERGKAPPTLKLLRWCAARLDR